MTGRLKFVETRTPMNTVDIKNRLHREIENGDTRLLKMMYALIREYKDESIGESVSIEQYNREIEEAMRRMDAGEFTPHEQVVELSKAWTSGRTKN